MTSEFFSISLSTYFCTFTISTTSTGKRSCIQIVKLNCLVLRKLTCFCPSSTEGELIPVLIKDIHLFSTKSSCISLKIAENLCKLFEPFLFMCPNPGHLSWLGSGGNNVGSEEELAVQHVSASADTSTESAVLINDVQLSSYGNPRRLMRQLFCYRKHFL